jgi:hypothetical protein
VKYFVYYNLHKHVFSLKNNKTKKVEMRSQAVVMKDCVFKVSEKGRQRVLKTQQKNVHAGVLGEVVKTDIDMNDALSIVDFVELTYNPYLFDSFVVKETQERVQGAVEVLLLNKRIFAKGIALKEGVQE